MAYKRKDGSLSLRCRGHRTGTKQQIYSAPPAVEFIEDANFGGWFCEENKYIIC